MFRNLKESTVQLQSGSIDYAVFGSGDKPFVIIPGLSLRNVREAGASLALMYRQFTKDYRVYVIDKKSDIPEGCTVADLAEACLTCDTYGRLKFVACPTLVLGSAEDKIVTGEASMEIVRRFGCEVHMYAGLGHSVYEEAADFNDRVECFLRKEI